jgi:hypothetical protein
VNYYRAQGRTGRACARHHRVGCIKSRKLRRSSSAVATSREGQRLAKIRPGNYECRSDLNRGLFVHAGLCRLTSSIVRLMVAINSRSRSLSGRLSSARSMLASFVSK